MFKLALTYLCVLLESNQIVFLGVAITKYRTKTNYCNHCSCSICTVKFKPPQSLVCGGLNLCLCSSGWLILPFSPINALTLKSQGTGLRVTDSHSYSNGSAFLGALDGTPSFYKFLGGLHLLGLLGMETCFLKVPTLDYIFNSLCEKSAQK